MADRLTAAQIGYLTRRNVRVKVTRTAVVDNDSITATDISDRIKEWGKVKFEVYNKHPDDLGILRFPFVDLVADNHDDYFDPGGTIFPNGLDDLYETTIRIQVILNFPDGSTFQELDFTGQVREPEYGDRKSLNLIVEHPLTVLTGRIWKRQDRIGGDTGIDFAFNS